MTADAPPSAEATSLPLGAALPRDRRRALVPLRLAQGTGWRAFSASFLVLFLAEWGDLSQLLTAGLVASGRPVVPVFFGSWLGLAFVAGMGVLLGRVLLRYVSLRIVRYVGAAVCLTLATVIAYQVVVDVVR